MYKLPMPIQDLVRLQDVKRWTVVNTTRSQSVAEHTCIVFFLAVELATRLDIPFNSERMREVMVLSMLHDIDEVYTGDIPTPVKDRMSDEDRKELSRHADEYKARNDVRTIVKIADLIEAVIFISEHGEGVHAVQVSTAMDNRLYDLLSELSPEYQNAANDMMTDMWTGERKW